MDFVKTVEDELVVLAEGAVIERLRRNGQVTLDRYVEHAGLIYQAKGRAALEKLFREYIDIGQAWALPTIACTVTWRANPDRLRAAGLGSCSSVCRDAFRFLDTIRQSYGDYAKRVYIGGLIGCRGDAYAPSEALAADEAARFHRTQVQALAACGVDFLIAPTLPASSEAFGLARAMAESGLPYVLSVIIRRAGVLLDGVPLHELVRKIDSEVAPRPVGYMVNCVHPTIFADGYICQIGVAPEIRERVLGLQANTSRKSPEELDNLGRLDEAESPDVFADLMSAVRQRTGIKILGGCCGTDDRHIRGIAGRVGNQGPDSSP